MLMVMMLIMIRLMLMMIILMTQLLHWILLNDDDTTDSASALNTTSGDGINVSSINTHHIACLTTPFWIICNDLQFHGFRFCWFSFVRRKVVEISSWNSWEPVLSSRVYQEVDQRFVYLVSDYTCIFSFRSLVSDFTCNFTTNLLKKITAASISTEFLPDLYTKFRPNAQP